MPAGRGRDRPAKREHLVALAVAVSLHAGLAAALTLSTPPEPLDIKLDLGFEMVELSPVEAPVTPSTPILKAPTPVKETEPTKVVQVEPSVPDIKKVLQPESTPQPIIQEIAEEPAPEVVALPEPAPKPTPVEEKAEAPSMQTDTRDALTAEQAAALPLLVASIDDDYIPPLSHSRYLHNPKPLYPRAARKRGMEGVVMINVRVNRDGHPVETVIHTSSGYGVLDRAALKAVNGWRFEAARRGNTRVEGEVLVPINFELNNS